MSHHALRPIFIIGSPRSGTTLIRLILDSHPHISCGPETHFLGLMEKIVGIHWATLRGYQFDKAYWQRKIADFFTSFQEEYARSRGKTRWAEKTPTYTMHLPFIDGIFPNCQFVHIIRDGRDVVTSHRERWGFRRALTSINNWRIFVEAAQSFGRTASENRYHELKYEDLVNDPEPVTRRLFKFLDEPWVPDVLEFDKKDHHIGESYTDHVASRRTELKDQSLIYKAAIGAGKRKLGPLLSLAFKFKNGKLLADLGYS